MKLIDMGKATDKSHLDKALEILQSGRSIRTGGNYWVTGDPSSEGGAWMCCSQGCCEAHFTSVGELWLWLQDDWWEAEEVK